jgi:hypothetical protein
MREKMKMPTKARKREYAARLSNRYDSLFKLNDLNKKKFNRIVGHVVEILKLRERDKALVLDDLGVATSKAVRKGAAALSCRDVLICNMGDDAKIAAMTEEARDIARICPGHAEIILPRKGKMLRDKLRVVAFDACGTATTVEQSGALQASIALMPNNQNSFISITFCTRKNARHAARDPVASLKHCINLQAQKRGLDAHAFFELPYRNMNSLFILLMPESTLDAEKQALLQRVTAACKRAIADSARFPVVEAEQDQTVDDNNNEDAATIPLDFCDDKDDDEPEMETTNKKRKRIPMRRFSDDDEYTRLYRSTRRH